MNFPINKLYYITIVVFIIASIYFLLIPKNKLPKFYSGAMGYQSKYEEYDWIETVKRQRIYLLLSIPYLVIFVILSNVFGEFIGKVGLVIFAFLTILAGIWIGPVRK